MPCLTDGQWVRLKHGQHQWPQGQAGALMTHATQLTSRIMAIGLGMGVITRSLRRRNAFMAVMGRLRLKASVWHGADMNLC